MSITRKKIGRKAVINKEGCDGNPHCPAMRSCPVGAITVKETTGSFIFKRVVLEVDEHKCTGCGKCVRSCARQIITLS